MDTKQALSSNFELDHVLSATGSYCNKHLGGGGGGVKIDTRRLLHFGNVNKPNKTRNLLAE